MRLRVCPRAAVGGVELRLGLGHLLVELLELVDRLGVVLAQVVGPVLERIELVGHARRLLAHVADLVGRRGRGDHQRGQKSETTAATTARETRLRLRWGARSTTGLMGIRP